MASREANKSPLTFVVLKQPLNMDMIRCIQDRQNGASVGFFELERLLDERTEQLKETIKLQQDNS